MILIENQLYHFYNQGNNKQPIFYNRDNYLFFLRKFRKYVHPYCKVLSYCLMPNHFHFQLYLTKHSLVEKQVGSITVPAVSEGFRQLLSSYTLAMNREYARSGSLFRQKTKKKLLERNGEYPFICFQYIHQNPLTAGLVGKMEEWEFSSFNDYVGIRHGNLCDQNLAYELLDLSRDTFYQESYSVISPEKVKGLY